MLFHIRKFFAKLASKLFHPVKSKCSADMIVRRVKVNRARSPQEAIEATGRAQYLDRKVVDEIPRGEGDEVDVVFLKPDLFLRDGFISKSDLEKELDLRGLKPADLISVAAVNEADPAFADQIPHCTQWKDAKGRSCYAAFHHLLKVREVDVYCNGFDWDGTWWFTGVRK